ncbi:MAG: histone deacetylase [Candidatus Aminicenantes bacterium]|jgi:acetoin utilization deacetylase AcuC-like enzyme
MKTGIVKDKRYMDHNMGDFHPESPKRLDAIYRMIDEDITFPFLTVEPRAATEEEVQWIHTASYVSAIKATSGKERVVLDPDTSTSAHSYEVALLAAGGVLKAIELILKSEVQNGFAFVRPPGHHAEASRAMGFCLFNNVAIGAEYLLKKCGQKQVLILDWDLHHGNGTQNSFYARNDVLYFSTHQFPHYPGTGHWSETGEGEGEGFTINIPLSPGKRDGEYLYIFDKILNPIADKFQPDFILVSAGFDIYEGDPLGGMQITSEGFGALAHNLLGLADKHCNERILFVLEGGYNLKGLSEGSKEVLFQLSGKKTKPDISASATPETQQELRPIFENLQKYYPVEP